MFTGVDSIVNSKAAGKSSTASFMKTVVTSATSVAGRWHELLSGIGTGGPITLTGTPGTGIVCNRSTPGSLPLGSDVSPERRHLQALTAFTPGSTIHPGILLLTDIIHIYPSCVLTGTPSTLSNHPTWTGSGDTRMTNAAGVQCSLVVTTAGSAGSGQITPTYVDQAGNTQAASSMYAVSSSAPAGSLYVMASGVGLGGPYMALAAGDTGVQSISSYAINAGLTSGVGAFILHRPIIEIPIVASSVAGMLEWILGERIYDNACLGCFIQVGAALAVNNPVVGSFKTVWG